MRISDWSSDVCSSDLVKEEGEWVEGDTLPHVDAATQLRRLAYWEKTLAALKETPVDQLSPEERINAAVFRTNLEQDSSAAACRAWAMQFNSDRSSWSYLNPRQGYRNPANSRRTLGRQHDVPRS